MNEQIGVLRHISTRC